MGDGASLESMRHAIAGVLRRHIQDEHLVRQVVGLWIQHFETRRPLSAGLTEFCNAVQDSCGLDVQRMGLFFELFKACQSGRRVAPRADPGPVSLPVISDSLDGVITQPGISGEVMPAGRALGILHRHLAASVLGRHRIAPHAWVHAVRQAIPSKLIARHPELHDWLNHPKSDLPGNWTPSNGGSELVNAWYVAMSQLLGPVEADRLLSKAVMDGETPAAELGISLRSFL